MGQFQRLHSDLFQWPLGFDDSNFDGKPPYIAVNFTVGNVRSHDGPMRILEGTHHATSLPPRWDEEPPEALVAAIAPLPPGCALIRDVRTWHSGTPNLGPRTRYLPSCEYTPPEYLDAVR